MSVGQGLDAVVKWMTKRWPKIGNEHDVLIPLVGECDDSWLNDAVGGTCARSTSTAPSIRPRADPSPRPGGRGHGAHHVRLQGGHRHELRRGTVGGAGDEPAYTIGVLVQSNFGHALAARRRRAGGPGARACLTGRSAPRAGTPARSSRSSRRTLLLSPQLVRVCKRAALGIGRCGSFAAHGSGEIVVAFSTANIVPREASRMTATLDVLLDEACDPLYEAVVECTEESIVNALCMADEMRGSAGPHRARAAARPPRRHPAPLPRRLRADAPAHR